MILSEREIQYYTPEQIAKQWNVSSRLIRKLCVEGKIHGAVQNGKFWFIPKDAQRPVDHRVVTGAYKRPGKKLQLLMKGLLNNCERALLIDLENDKALDVMHCFHADEIEEVYSRMLERYVNSGKIYEEDIPYILSDASITNLRLKLSTNDKMELHFRYREESGNYIRMTSRYAICDREGGAATYAVLTFEKKDNSYIDQELEKNIYEYYYTDVIKQDYKVYSVLYDYENKEFWVETGPDIISAVPLTDYLNEYNLRKASYSKEEIKQILSMINDDYQKKKELEGKGKVLIKDNSMY